ncbi:MAG: nucleotide exchange factor GrpE [Dehalococcoidales bacterium]
MIQEPEEELTNEVEPRVAETEAVEALKQALAEEKEKAEKYLANWQRAQADFINYKRRSEQERAETTKFANSVLMLSLLPVLDDLERALNFVLPELAEPSWLEGVRLIERKMKATLEAQGLSAIEALGKPFDPNFHEAVRQDKGKEGIVIEEIQKGYKLHDRVIRPSRVVVGNGEVEEEKENNREDSALA